MRLDRRNHQINPSVQVPTNVQCPPGVHIGNTTVPYPTFTIDVAKTHESENQLVADAVNKHFAAMTGVMVWLGIRIYPTHHMKITLLERDVTQGFGAVYLLWRIPDSSAPLDHAPSRSLFQKD
jgi:hypothetical protein